MENKHLTRDFLRHRREPDVDVATPLTLVAATWLRDDLAREALGCSRATMQRLRSSGRLAYAKLGRKIYYRITDIDRLILSALITDSNNF